LLCLALAGSTLALLVARVSADDANNALALDDLALRADRFDAGSNFHGTCSLVSEAEMIGEVIDVREEVVAARDARVMDAQGSTMGG
jgi:hypothetical protein